MFLGLDQNEELTQQVRHGLPTQQECLPQYNGGFEKLMNLMALWLQKVRWGVDAHTSHLSHLRMVGNWGPV